MFNIDDMETNPSDFKKEIEDSLSAKISSRIIRQDFPESYEEKEE